MLKLKLWLKAKMMGKKWYQSECKKKVLIFYNHVGQNCSYNLWMPQPDQ